MLQHDRELVDDDDSDVYAIVGERIQWDCLTHIITTIMWESRVR